jgi:alkanesulfonate monooxygenase SsuD/methylene tetrahydromethanopterin reductase-like flavin-dependent oxidoreductase (luciferase family)
MPYTDLPSDFKEKHASVWVDIDPSLFDAAKANGMYNDFLDELELAAEVGFDGVCVNEHHSNGYGLMPSPNLIAATLTRRTRDAAICVMGNSLALYNPPIRVAEEFAMLDCISGGRLIAGFPVGTPMDTCYAYGQNPSQLRERYHEAHDLIVRAWAAEEPFTFHGRYNQLRYVNPWPRPVQRPHPPIWIPGGGSIETWQWCAEQDYVYAYLSYFGYQQGEATMRGFWNEMQRLGKDPNPYRAGFLQFVGVAETREEALELYAEPALYFYERCLHVDARYAAPPGYASEATLRARVKSQVVAAAERATGAEAFTRPGFEDIVTKGYVIVGSPDEVAEQLREVAVNLNVGQLMLLLQFGNMSKDLAFYNTEQFAKRVAPQLRGLFENEWENRWWPRPLPAPRRATARELRPRAPHSEASAAARGAARSEAPSEAPR